MKYKRMMFVVLIFFLFLISIEGLIFNASASSDIVSIDQWGITSSGFTSTSTHTTIRYMGGTSPNQEATVTHLYIRCGSSGTVSIALYTGGSLSNPTTAVRRTGAHGVSVTSGWNAIDVPDYVLSANTITWIGWAHSCSVYYSSSSSNAGDFQSERGRWNQDSPSNYDETTALPTNPGSGSFRNYWYAVYAEYTTDGTPPPPEGEWGITSSSFTSTSTHSVVRYMGGTSPNVDVTITELHIRCGSSGTVSIALYTGGSLSNPTSAVRRTEAHGVAVSSGWNAINVPDYAVPANSITWIGWAHSCSVYYSSSSSNAGDFQSARGRWSQSSPSNYDENTALPTNPGSGSFNNYWYAVYAKYTTEPVPPDTTPPTVSITNPADGATVSGSITVTASASDNVGVSKVEFYIDDVLKTTDTSSPYSYVWDTTTYSNGSHTVKAIAYDAADNTDTDTHAVTVENGATPPDPPTHDPYMSYTEYTSYLQDIDSNFPEITKIYSANDYYGVATSTAGGREVWTIEVTDESVTDPKGDVLLIGTHHGNEKISFETALYTLEQLITGWINNDPYICYLLQTRKIVIVPMMNPDGYSSNSRYNANGKDLNRNYDYDQTVSNSFSEVESKCIREIVEVNDFTTSISWHSGVHIIIYPWGADVHSTPGPDPCPDDKAHEDMAALMSQEGGTYGEGYYDYGICNDELYSVNGGYEDWVYAGLDEPQYTHYGSYDKANVLNFCVEVSSTKTPSSSQVPGWSAKNWEIAKVCIDFAMPYARFSNAPSSVSAGSQFNVDWTVGGCFDVDVTQVAYSDDPSGVIAPTPSGSNWYGLTSSQSGKSFWYDATGFSTTIQAPSTPGTYYLALRVEADSAYYSTGVYSSWIKSRYGQLYFSVVHQFTVS